MYGTARSPREANTGTPTDATLREAGPDHPVHGDMVADPHLRDEAAGILPAKVPQFVVMTAASAVASAPRQRSFAGRSVSDRYP
jgi:hypothetical protein